MGTARSGTTLLQNLMVKNFNLQTFTESHYFFERYFPPLEKLNVLPLLSDRFWFRRPMRWSKNNFSKFFIENQIASPDMSCFGSREFINILDGEALRLCSEGWVEKTPGHLRRIPVIDHYCSDAFFIHIYRNLEDVIESWRKIYESHDKEGKYFKYNPVKIRNNWLRDCERTAHYINKNPTKHIAISYEELCMDSSEVVKKISEFLNLNADSRSCPEVVGISSHESWKGNNYKPVFLNSTDLSAMDVECRRAYLALRSRYE